VDEGISCNGNGNGDETQRLRLARILRDPTGYYADARKEAHAHARRFLATRLRARRA
jgi:hypothetical protein